ncbi:hypothetical protein [Bacillus taeanensis]|uniref:hypothetical protein n=1 Tax=Bacillus taeanensis TaxID=273032 RepID=UPI0015F0B926|nr:hypothetical protein [Bacillus taeanensis]
MAVTSEILDLANFAQNRYIEMIKEFEDKLGRQLTDKERHFIDWMIEQELKDKLEAYER